LRGILLLFVHSVSFVLVVDEAFVSSE
jgi:hypothetical protein